MAKTPEAYSLGTSGRRAVWGRGNPGQVGFWLVPQRLQPLRKRVQRLVDRRFNRASSDVAATVAGFSAKLRDAILPSSTGKTL